MNVALSTTRCSDCGDEPSHPGSVVRMVGRNAQGDTVVLCSKCFIRRERDAAAPMPQLKKKGSKR